MNVLSNHFKLKYKCEHEMLWFKILKLKFDLKSSYTNGVHSIEIPLWLLKRHVGFNQRY